uniref:FKBP prolyl isomerase 7 n=1 Tax=Chelonoidis abingdonii TaxID=106734 RepID=A0A8C0QLZ9_CHEAB
MPRTSMTFGVKLVFFLQAFCLLTIRTHGQKKEDATAEEVKIEVLHVPKECTPKSKKGDLLNAHYDGYLAGDGSKFYCRRHSAPTCVIWRNSAKGNY